MRGGWDVKGWIEGTEVGGRGNRGRKRIMGSGRTMSVGWRVRIRRSLFPVSHIPAGAAGRPQRRPSCVSTVAAVGRATARTVNEHTVPRHQEQRKIVRRPVFAYSSIGSLH